MKSQVAVIILNWNGEKLLQKFLPSVVKHTPVSIGRVIVADNGSSDNSIEVLAKEFPDVEVLQFDKNHGFAEGYNLAIRHYCAEYEYAVLLNSDVEVKDDWLSPLYEYMRANHNVAACQPKILSYNDPTKFEYAGACGGFIDRNGYPYCRGRIFASVEVDNGQYDTAIDTFWATGAALMVRCKEYVECGGLDPLFFAHMEEIDLCWRMQLNGYKVSVVPQSKVYHLGGGSLNMGNPRKTYLNFRNNLLMMHKNLPIKVGRKKILVRKLLDAIAAAKFAIALDFKNVKAIYNAHKDFNKMKGEYTNQPNNDILTTSPRRPNILLDYYLRRKTKWSDI